MAARPNDVRKWLGLYVLYLTTFLGGYAFLAPDLLLPLELSDRIAAFEIILPLLLAQVAAVYRFYSSTTRPEVRLGIPNALIKAPLILVTLLLGLELILFAIAGLRHAAPPSPEAFKGLVTFCVALLNASTVLIISRYFEAQATEPKEQPS